jgi:hypothetical protein
MEKFLIAVGAVALFVGLVLLFTWPTVIIINYLFTAQLLTLVFGAAKITFWKAFWLSALTGWLFKSYNSNSGKEKK